MRPAVVAPVYCELNRSLLNPGGARISPRSRAKKCGGEHSPVPSVALMYTNETPLALTVLKFTASGEIGNINANGVRAFLEGGFRKRERQH